MSQVATAATGEEPGGEHGDRSMARRRATVGAGCVGAGLLLCAALPPWGWWPLAFAGLVALDRLVAHQPWRVRLTRGGVAGLALYLPSLIWMQALTLPGYLVASAAYAGMLGAGVALAPPGRGRWLALAGTWTAIELIRWSWPFGGVPLSSLAIGQVAGPLAPVLRVGGAPLLTLTTVAAGGALAAAVARDRRWAAALSAGVVVLVAGSAVAPTGREIDRVEVALVQGGGEQGTRKSSTSVIEVFRTHVDATALVAPPVDLVVWPEDVVDTDEALADDPWAEEISELAAALGAPMVVGAVEGDGPDTFRNAATLFDSSGTITDRYEKVRRVPFGEYVPLRPLLEPFAGSALPARDAAVGDGPAHLDVEGDVGRVAVTISWEVFFGDRSREGVEAGAGVILNPTNGASFTGTIVQTQQVASSRMRAIENGRWVAQVAPTGFTAVIDDDGQVLERSAVSERRVVQRDVAIREGLTIYTRFGNALALLLAAAAVAAGWWVQRRSTAVASSVPPAAP